MMTCKRRTPKGSDCGCNKGVACQCWNFMSYPNSRPFTNIVYVFENYPTADETHPNTIGGGTIHWTGLHTLFNFTRVIAIDRETCEVDMSPISHGFATRRCTLPNGTWAEQDFTLVTVPDFAVFSSSPITDGGSTHANRLWRLVFSVTAVGPRRGPNIFGCNLAYTGMCHSVGYEFGTQRPIGLWSSFCPGWDDLIDFPPEEIQGCDDSPSTGYWYRV